MTTTSGSWWACIQAHLCHSHSYQHCGAEVDYLGTHGLRRKKSEGRYFRHSAINDSCIFLCQNPIPFPSHLQPSGLDHDDGKWPDGVTMVLTQKKNWVTGSGNSRGKPSPSPISCNVCLWQCKEGTLLLQVLCLCNFFWQLLAIIIVIIVSLSCVSIIIVTNHLLLSISFPQLFYC